MKFLRVVEVFPPIIQGRQGGSIDLERATRSFIDEVSGIRDYADLVVVANLKNLGLTTASPTAVASLLVSKAGIDAAPVLVVRDSDRKEIASTILGAYSLGLRSLMLAWGDKQVGPARRIGEFARLSQALAYASEISGNARVRGRFFAPVDLDRLPTRAGVDLAKSRLKSGAVLLLAQPPTADSRATLESHLALLDSCGLRRKVLLSVFPFRDREDVLRSERYFGWKLPSSLKHRASLMGYAPLDEARALAQRLRKEGMPGVYLSTRGSPEIARQVLA